MCVRVAWRLAGPGAGFAAAAALLAVTGFLRFTALGDSEGLLIALMLVGVDRHLDGADGQAAGAWLLACLLRPEVWLLAGAFAVRAVAPGARAAAPPRRGRLGLPRAVDAPRAVGLRGRAALGGPRTESQSQQPRLRPPSRRWPR